MELLELIIEFLKNNKRYHQTNIQLNSELSKSTESSKEENQKLFKVSCNKCMQRT